ncbi:hypothetical protein OG308_23345 [Nocardia salmonicida]|uniref:Uncharacterized protein n=1 Tax=Nocardia salmonicida TaxID=53431 RepID=A0ABZ1N335_9NOCA
MSPPQTLIGRHFAAIEAGIDPYVVVAVLHSMQAHKAATGAGTGPEGQ